MPSNANDWKLLGGLTFITIAIPALCALLWWLGTHWDDKEQS
jgi:hypothetical protein